MIKMQAVVSLQTTLIFHFSLSFCYTLFFLGGKKKRYFHLFPHLFCPFLSLVTQWETLPRRSCYLGCHVHLWRHSGQQHSKWRNVQIPGNSLINVLKHPHQFHVNPPGSVPARAAVSALAHAELRGFRFASVLQETFAFRIRLPKGDCRSLKSFEIYCLDRHFGKAKLSSASWSSNRDCDNLFWQMIEKSIRWICQDV